MRISDEERHEVAQKLRERTKKPMGKSMQRMFTETLDIYAHNICWMNPDKATNRWDVIVNYLAELIDRPTCAIVESYMGGNLEYVEETPYHVLSCGHVAYGEDDPMFCPVCGAAVTDDYR